MTFLTNSSYVGHHIRVHSTSIRCQFQCGLVVYLRGMESLIWVMICSGKGWSLVQRQTITRTNVDLLSIEAKGIILFENWIRTQWCSFKNTFDDIISKILPFLLRPNVKGMCNKKRISKLIILLYLFPATLACSFFRFLGHVCHSASR